MTTEKALPSLKAMAEAKLEGISKLTNFYVDPDLLEIEPGFNLRTPGPELDEHLERMYQAMKAGAAMPPIDVIVKEGRIVVRRGHCRTVNAKRLKAEGIPYKLECRHYRGNETDQVFDMLGENMGKPFTPLEQGVGFLRLLRYGLKSEQIATRMGLSRTAIENGLKLAEAPVAVQKLLSGNKVSVQVALEALRTKGDKAADYLTELVKKAEGGKKVTKKHTAPKGPSKKAMQSVYAAVSPLKKTLSHILGNATENATQITIVIHRAEAEILLKAIEAAK